MKAVFLAVGMLATLGVGQAFAGEIVTYYDPYVSPAVTYVEPAPTETYYEPVPAVRYVEPAPVVTYRPWVSYSPVFESTVFASPPAYVAPAAVPVVTYYGAPVIRTTPGYYVARRPAYYYYRARPAVVRSRMYVPGQPVRNALRVLAP